MSRKKIHYLLAKTTAIKSNAGDSITEIGIIKALSVNYDVYYNDKLFYPNKKDFGLNQQTVLKPSRNYDLYITRNNPEFFRSIKSGKKIYFAAPYDEVCFRTANRLYTFTNSWTTKLNSGKYKFPNGVYPDKYKSDKAITLSQVVDRPFFKKHEESSIAEMRKRLGGGTFIIGHFGRVANSCYPWSFVALLKKLRRRHRGLNVVFCGNNRTVHEFGQRHRIRTMSFSYDEMPLAIASCDLILYNYRDLQGQIAGSMKILEAMASGVPILSPKYDARVEELGADYDLFYPYQNICKTGGNPTQKRFSSRIERTMYSLINKSIMDKEWLDGISLKIKKRAEYYSIDESAHRFKKLIDEVIL